VPLIVAVGAWRWWRHKTVRPLVLLGLAYGGAEVLFQTVKALTGRARPPATVALHHYSGFAFPSGHATLSVAVWCALAALVAAATPSWRNKVIAWAAAFFLAAVVGVSRLYLGAHWLTDVLGGWSLGALWLTAVLGAVRPTNVRASHAAQEVT
jgi:undecaprenyl-diphosphatase